MITRAILLAAGESARMGTPKPLLDWFGRPLVVAQVDSLLEAGTDSVTVVAGANANPIENALGGISDVEVAPNPDYKTGKASSVRVGVNALGNPCDCIVLLAVDQPRPSWVVSEILSAHVSAHALITSPRYDGHGGHPLVFSSDLRSELQDVTDARQGVRDIMTRYLDEVNEVQIDTPIIRLDLNTPQDYEAALATYPTLSRGPA